MNAVLLRYFNPVGAHKSGRIGEDPQVSDMQGKTYQKLIDWPINNVCKGDINERHIVVLF